LPFNYKAVSKAGFFITSPAYGSYRFVPHRVFAGPKEAVDPEIPWNHIIVSTKALPDVSEDSEILTGLMKDNYTAILPVQNGSGVECSMTRDRSTVKPTYL
jgi:2-dehydropantoate 2-reductase